VKSGFQPVDLALVGDYFVFLLFVGFRFFGIARRDATEYLLMGRKLALP